MSFSINYASHEGQGKGAAMRREERTRQGKENERRRKGQRVKEAWRTKRYPHEGKENGRPRRGSVRRKY